ncbi:MAG TPA: DUF2066 domain-containing protein, partial [Gammaproteobacteria bacterium]|nr:DUF2066 domain-containing protein [Gammaproteobacteria bacterium]
NPRIQSRLLTANNLLQEYAYEYSKNQDAENRYLLQLHFDKRAVNQWLRDVSAPIWGQNRPPVFAWIVSEKPNMIQIILNTDPSIPTTLRENASRRGIPLFFPAKNPPNILPTVIMSMSVNKIISATKRYNNVLIGYIQENSNGYSTQWKLVSGKDTWDFNVAGATEKEILEKVMDQAANALAGKFAVITTNNIQKNIELRVVGISEQTDFAKLIRYLSRLTPVASVSIGKIDGDEILLNVSLRSTEASFTQAISLSQKLLPVAVMESTEPLIYQWNPS